MRLLKGLKGSSPCPLPRPGHTTLEAIGGWGEGLEDPGDAEAAVVYGQWADLLYMKVACLFLCAALADLALWAATGSVTSLLGPGSLLILCLMYLDRRRRFRRTVRRNTHRTEHGDRGRWLERPESGSGDGSHGPGGYKLTA